MKTRKKGSPMAESVPESPDSDKYRTLCLVKPEKLSYTIYYHLEKKSTSRCTTSNCLKMHFANLQDGN